MRVCERYTTNIAAVSVPARESDQQFGMMALSGVITLSILRRLILRIGRSLYDDEVWIPGKPDCWFSNGRFTIMVNNIILCQ